MRAFLPILIFVPPGVTQWRPIFVFWVRPLGDLMKVSKRCRGCGVGVPGAVSIVTYPLLIDLACDLPLRAVERRER
jgi:hypothetical protein